MLGPDCSIKTLCKISFTLYSNFNVKMNKKCLIWYTEITLQGLVDLAAQASKLDQKGHIQNISATKSSFFTNTLSKQHCIKIEKVYMFGTLKAKFFYTIKLIWEQILLLIFHITRFHHHVPINSLGGISIQRCRLASIGIPMLMIRRSHRLSYL